MKWITLVLAGVAFGFFGLGLAAARTAGGGDAGTGWIFFLIGLLFLTFDLMLLIALNVAKGPT